MVQYPNGEVWERINEQVKPMLTPCILWPSVTLAAEGRPVSDVVKQSFSSPQWIFFKNLPSLPSYLIIHWKLWEWLPALMKDLLFHTGMVLVSLWHFAQTEFQARYSIVWCECLFLLLVLSAAAPHNNHSCLPFLLEGTFDQVLLGEQECGVRAPRPQQAVRWAVPHWRPAVCQPLPPALALDLRGAHRPPRPQDLPPPGWQHGPAHRVQGARQLPG